MTPPEVFAARRPLLAELAGWVAADEPAEVPVPYRIGVDPQDLPARAEGATR